MKKRIESLHVPHALHGKNKPKSLWREDMFTFSVTTNKRTEFINITKDVQNAIDELNIKSGVISVFIPHTTAGITINENADPDVMIDMESALEKIVPWHAGYRHCEGNSAAHLKASMMGSSVQLIVENGSIQRGTWQGIYFSEFDGPRTRKVWVSK